jgi:gentisate 1,2-dioxygenase
LKKNDFYKNISKLNMAPLWEVLSKLVTPEPNTRTKSHIWYWKDTMNHVLDAGSIISAEQAERRVLILENPNMRGESKITDTLYAGLQLILPGEIAPSHRHTQSALRFVMHGNGAYTAVDGEKTIMRPGDFIITPSWTWHDHGNESEEPMIWLDGLDIPMVNHLSASFAEKLDETSQELKRLEGDSLARYGSGLLPVDHKLFENRASPVFSYPYERTKEALDKMKRSDEWDICHGLKLKYVNPSNGGHAIPTMATFMQLIPKSFSGNSYKSTDGTIYSVVEGSGETSIDDKVFNWTKGDIFVVPPWAKIAHKTKEESVLFSFSDRPVQEALGLFREKFYK